VTPLPRNNAALSTKDEATSGSDSADESAARQLFSNEAPEEAGLRKLECLLQDFLSDRECLAQACRDPPDKTTRLGVAEACAGIAEAVLDAKSQDKASHNTRVALAAANAPRALEWVRHALRLGHGVRLDGVGRIVVEDGLGRIKSERERVLLDRAVFLEARALEKMGYLAAAKDRFERLATPCSAGKHSTSSAAAACTSCPACQYQENAGVDSVCVHVEANEMLKKSNSLLQKTVQNFQTTRSDANGKSLYNKKPEGQLDGKSPVKGLPGVTVTFIVDEISEGHMQMPVELGEAIELLLKNKKEAQRRAAEDAQEGGLREIPESLRQIRAAPRLAGGCRCWYSAAHAVGQAGERAHGGVVERAAHEQARRTE
jgi:hypothetical protein